MSLAPSDTSRKPADEQQVRNRPSGDTGTMSGEPAAGGDLLIHIGYPKTASTWLQQVIFDDENAGFVSPWGTQSGLAVDQFVTVNSFKFSPESARGAFRDGLSDARRRRLVPVLSQEMLAGDQVLGKYCGREVADRVHAAFPAARILILVREQKSMVLSSYREHLRLGGTKTLPQFVGAVRRHPGFAPICQLEYLEYDHLIAYYSDRFGPDRVLVLPFESLRKSTESAVDRVMRFAGANGRPDCDSPARNVGLHSATLAWSRRLNCLVPFPDFSEVESRWAWRPWYYGQRLLAVLNRMIPERRHQRARSQLEQFISEYVGDRFRESNRRTAALIGVDIRELGYDC